MSALCCRIPDGSEAIGGRKYVSGDRAVFLWTYEGTNSGPGGTGHTVRFNGWEQWTFGGDGLVAVSDGRFDTVEYARQLAEGI